MISRRNYILFRFTYWRKESSNPLYYFIISIDWGSAFNAFYSIFDPDEVTITTVDLCATESIDMLIDSQYLIDNKDFAPISINGLNVNNYK